jgi:hypothetical protein
MIVYQKLRSTTLRCKAFVAAWTSQLLIDRLESAEYIVLHVTPPTLFIITSEDPL